MWSAKGFSKLVICFLTQIPDQAIKRQRVACGKENMVTFKASNRETIQVNLNVVNMAVGARQAGVIYKRLIWDFYTSTTILGISSELSQKERKKIQ